MPEDDAGQRGAHEGQDAQDGARRVPRDGSARWTRWRVSDMTSSGVERTRANARPGGGAVECCGREGAAEGRRVRDGRVPLRRAAPTGAGTGATARQRTCASFASVRTSSWQPPRVSTTRGRAAGKRRQPSRLCPERPASSRLAADRGSRCCSTGRSADRRIRAGRSSHRCGTTNWCDISRGSRQECRRRCTIVQPSTKPALRDGEIARSRSRRRSHRPGPSVATDRARRADPSAAAVPCGLEGHRG